MSSSKQLIFAAAMMISAVNAWDDIEFAMNGVQNAIASGEVVLPHHDKETNAYWREAEHEEEPISEEAYHAESEHSNWTDSADDEPLNYFLESPDTPLTATHLTQREMDDIKEDRTQEESDILAMALTEELRDRHLGHKYVKQPISSKTSISGVGEKQVRSTGYTQLVETIYDDMTMDRLHVTTETDEIVDTKVSFLPDNDGILQTFIDRYTTMLIHDSVFMEEMPAPHFMHQEFSMLHPMVSGDLKHDPRDHHKDLRYEPEHEWESDSEDRQFTL